MPDIPIPKVGDKFHDAWDQGVYTIVEVGDTVISGRDVGRFVVCDNGIEFDCFWSFENRRFQYFPDGYRSEE